MKTTGILLTLLLLISPLLTMAQVDEAKVQAFISEHASKNGLAESEVQAILDQATFQQDIIDKISRPAEGTMTWGRYRRIFMTPERIAAGVAFWQEHEATLAKVSADTGVPEEVILGIIGVETYFGKIKGSYKVLDALYTLAFGYPKRSRFFTKELPLPGAGQNRRP